MIQIPQLPDANLALALTAPEIDISAEHRKAAAAWLVQESLNVGDYLHLLDGGKLLIAEVGTARFVRRA